MPPGDRAAALAGRPLDSWSPKRTTLCISDLIPAPDGSGRGGRARSALGPAVRVSAWRGVGL